MSEEDIDFGGLGEVKEDKSKESIVKAKQTSKKIVAKPAEAKVIWRPKETPAQQDKVKNTPVIPQPIQENTTAKRLRLYNELYNISIHEREKLILDKYAKEMEEFRKKLGTQEFGRALGEFMLERIEGKLLAARETVEE